MKFRLITALALAGALGLSLSGAQAGATPVMDGKKVKVLTITANAGLQDNDKDFATGLLATADHSICAAPRCAKLPFVYKPAKGAKGGLMFTMTWKNAVISDLDLYVYELDKRGNGTRVGVCGGVGTASEKVYLPAGNLKSGKTYVMIMDFFRSVNDVASGKVEIGVDNTIPTKVPAQVDSKEAINCTL